MSKHHSLLQSFGAVMVLDGESRRIQAVSRNLTKLLGLADTELRAISPATVLGKRLSQRLRQELHGRQRLASPLAFRRLHDTTRLQVHAYRTHRHVVVEIEPLSPLGKRRLLGTVNERLMRLAEATHQEELLDYLVTAVQQLTGHDRVSVCHFDSDWHGLIVAEAQGGHLPALLGQRFPASDFPITLRRTYERHPIRLIHDASAHAEPPLPCTPEGESVDLRHCFLRAPRAGASALLAAVGRTRCDEPGHAGRHRAVGLAVLPLGSASSSVAASPRCRSHPRPDGDPAAFATQGSTRGSLSSARTR